MHPLFTRSLLFLTHTSLLNVSPLAPFAPFCRPSLQCNADFSKGGGMVQIGGVPWIIVEDIFTLTHFGVPIAPSFLKLPQPCSVLSQHKMLKWATNAWNQIAGELCGLSCRMNRRNYWRMLGTSIMTELAQSLLYYQMLTWQLWS